MTTEHVYTLFGSIFLVGLTIAVVSTGARLLWYLRWHQPLPRLLPRDVISKGGTWLSFAPIVILRIFITNPMDRTAFTTGNVTWALLTSVPIAIAVWTYVYFEVFVIPRDTDRKRRAAL